MPPCQPKNLKKNRFFAFFWLARGHFSFYHFQVVKNKKSPLASQKKMHKQIDFLLCLGWHGGIFSFFHFHVMKN
jgi:divalent metal cation (Fe/Co/Zn/Cd) transporter